MTAKQNKQENQIKAIQHSAIWSKGKKKNFGEEGGGGVSAQKYQNIIK